jgi:hypothetical protein
MSLPLSRFQKFIERAEARLGLETSLENIGDAQLERLADGARALLRGETIDADRF